MSMYSLCSSTCDWEIGATYTPYPHSGCSQGSCDSTYIRGATCPTKPSLITDNDFALFCEGEGKFIVTLESSDCNYAASWFTNELNHSFYCTTKCCTRHYLRSDDPTTAVNLLCGWSAAPSPQPTPNLTQVPTPNPSWTPTVAPTVTLSDPTPDPTPLPLPTDSLQNATQIETTRLYMKATDHTSSDLFIAVIIVISISGAVGFLALGLALRPHICRKRSNFNVDRSSNKEGASRMGIEVNLHHGALKAIEHELQESEAQGADDYGEDKRKSGGEMNEDGDRINKSNGASARASKKGRGKRGKSPYRIRF